MIFFGWLFIRADAIDFGLVLELVLELILELTVSDCEVWLNELKRAKQEKDLKGDDDLIESRNRKRF